LDSFASLLFSTYVGDSRAFQVSGLALDPSGSPVFCGNTYLSVPAGAWLARYDTSGVPAVRLDALNNLASRLAVAASPGELVAVNGAGFAADAQVFFDDVAATMLPGSNAPTAIVPYSLAGQDVTLAHLEAGGQRSNAVQVPVAPAAPGIFTVAGTGTGQALAFNQDGTANSQASPAPVGSVVTFYATGVGQTTPPGVDGVLHRGEPASPVLPIAVYIAYNVASTVQVSVGAAPGFSADVLMVRATVPPLGIQPAGNSLLWIVENGIPSQGAVTIWISQ
jgi:uncharacterized protein (TIGR03437 family)